MKKLILILITVLTLNSCYLFRENGIEVEIENKSDTSISNVKFTTSEDLDSLDFSTINPNVKVSGF